MKNKIENMKLNFVLLSLLFRLMLLLIVMYRSGHSVEIKTAYYKDEFLLNNFSVRAPPGKSSGNL